MTDTQNNLVCALIGNIFGPISEQIVKKLCECDFATLQEIFSFCRESDKKVKIDLVSYINSIIFLISN